LCINFANPKFFTKVQIARMLMFSLRIRPCSTVVFWIWNFSRNRYEIYWNEVQIHRHY